MTRSFPTICLCILLLFSACVAGGDARPVGKATEQPDIVSLERTPPLVPTVSPRFYFTNEATLASLHAHLTKLPEQDLCIAVGGERARLVTRWARCAHGVLVDVDWRIAHAQRIHRALLQASRDKTDYRGLFGLQSRRDVVESFSKERGLDGQDVWWWADRVLFSGPGSFHATQTPAVRAPAIFNTEHEQATLALTAQSADLVRAPYQQANEYAATKAQSDTTVIAQGSILSEKLLQRGLARLRSNTVASVTMIDFSNTWRFFAEKAKFWDSRPLRHTTLKPPEAARRIAQLLGQLHVDLASRFTLLFSYTPSDYRSESFMFSRYMALDIARQSLTEPAQLRACIANRLSALEAFPYDPSHLVLIPEAC